jgi:putative endonuclease
MAPTSASMVRRVALGRYGEQLALRHLLDQGMVLLDRNWTHRDGELDLVLRDGDVLVACEVKTRSSLACGSPLEAVGAAKHERLNRLALCWLEERGLSPRAVRIDVVGVLRPRRGPSVVEHVRGLC